MAFENVWATPEDVKKYNLSRFWTKYHLYQWQDENVRGRGVGFTIDRKTGIYLVPYSGFRESIYKREFVLHWRDEDVFMRVDRDTEKSSGWFDEISPYRIVWDLLHVGPPSHMNEQNQELLDVFKGALRAYRDCGVHSEYPDAIVDFNF
ncbi:hypothetical protein [Thiosocius teredinicola]|uniref:hypothetical protein n=1 Tax=Thiosocius teredinicola TaxID=1973002 RepID=UPI0009914F02